MSSSEIMESFPRLYIPKFGIVSLLFTKEKVSYRERKPPWPSQKISQVHKGLESHLAAALG